MLRTSSRLKGDYQQYPSSPFGYSYEYAGNHLRGQFRCIAMEASDGHSYSYFRTPYIPIKRTLSSN